MQKIVLKGADIIVQNSQSYVKDGSIYIEDGAIKNVGHRAEIDALCGGAKTVDCSGLMLLPGLINSHNHPNDILYRGLGKEYGCVEFHRVIEYPINKILSQDDYYWAALLTSMDALRNGNTSIVVHCTNFTRFACDAIADGFLAGGIRAAVARGCEDNSRIDPECNRPVDEDIRELDKFLSSWGHRSDRIQAWAGPSGVWIGCSEKLLRGYKEVAQEKGARFHMHIAETRDEAEDIRRLGYIGSLGYAHSLGLIDSFTSLAHACWLNEAEIVIAKSHGAQIVHCPTSNMILASGIPLVPRMLASGATVAIGTDSAECNDSLDIIQEMKVSALLYRAICQDTKVLSSRDVFKMATEQGAKVSGGGSAGRLEAECPADIVGIKLHHNPSLNPIYDPIDLLVFSASGRDVALTMVAGKIVYKDGVFSDFDADKIFSKIENIRRKIVAALP